LDGVEYQVYFRVKREKDRLIKLLRGMPLGVVRHVSVTRGVVYAFVRPDPGLIGGVVQGMFRLAVDSSLP